MLEVGDFVFTGKICPVGLMLLCLGANSLSLSMAAFGISIVTASERRRLKHVRTFGGPS